MKHRTHQRVNTGQTISETTQRVNDVHRKLGSSPLILWLLGGLSILLWLAGTVVQVQTSEFLALGDHARVSGVAWSVLAQPWFLITGQVPVSQATADLYGWTVELITLVFAMVLSAAVAHISRSNPHLGKWFILFGSVLILLNGWADYSSSPGGNPLVQFLIALAIGGVVVIGLPLGIGLISQGFAEV